jgi:anthranilate phosphoribosyltransferase
MNEGDSMAMATLDELGGWKSVLTTLTSGQDLSATESGAAMRSILAGQASPAQIAAFIVGLRMKGEAIEEVSGMVDAMLSSAAPVELAEGIDAVDIVGTGGATMRRVHALNVSTMACFVTAGAGVPVCKHGNRKASSTSGSFDLLDALGVRIDLDGAGVARCVSEAGVGFCFARAFHPAMRHAGPVRAELGIPTVFNFLGPLSNPARVRRQVIGVSDLRMAPTVVGVLRARGLERAMVVHGDDGMDELTVTAPSTVYELRSGEVREYRFDPRDLGLSLVDAEKVKGGDELVNAELARRVFAGEPGPYRDIVTLNAAAGLVVGGMVDSLAEGIERAAQAIDDGRATDALETLIRVSNESPRH